MSSHFLQRLKMTSFFKGTFSKFAKANGLVSIFPTAKQMTDRGQAHNLKAKSFPQSLSCGCLHSVFHCLGFQDLLCIIWQPQLVATQIYTGHYQNYTSVCFERLNLNQPLWNKTYQIFLKEENLHAHNVKQLLLAFFTQKQKPKLFERFFFSSK